MFNLMNLLAITASQQEPYLSPEEIAQKAQELQDKKIWLTILIVLLLVEIFLAVGYPKLKEKRRKKEEKKAERKAIQSKKKSK